MNRILPAHFAMLAACAGLLGQAVVSEPAFEVASIKAADPDSHIARWGQLRNGRYQASNVTLRNLIAAASGMSEVRVFGPDWLDSTRFDVEAKSPEGVPDSDLRPMLLALLKERFRLDTHTESREMAVFELMVAKDGPKMPEFPGKARPTGINRAGAMMDTTMTMAELAEWLSISAERPVLDNTGLTAKYNVALAFNPPGFLRNHSDLELEAPDLFAALQEQLGLRLQPAKAMVTVTVVDHIERTPSEN